MCNLGTLLLRYRKRLEKTSLDLKSFFLLAVVQFYVLPLIYRESQILAVDFVLKNSAKNFNKHTSRNAS